VIGTLIGVSLALAMGLSGLFFLRVIWEMPNGGFILLFCSLVFIPAVLFKLADAVRFVKQLIRR
jgi:hypothetical protein